MEDCEPLTPAKRTSEDQINVNSPSDKTPLSPEQKTLCSQNKQRAQLLKLSRELPLITIDIGVTWYEALKEVFNKDWFKKLSEFVCKERKCQTIFPSPSEVWSWTSRVPISDVKVVILGQDPYHGPGQAHGLCFR